MKVGAVFMEQAKEVPCACACVFASFCVFENVANFGENVNDYGMMYMKICIIYMLLLMRGAN